MRGPEDRTQAALTAREDQHVACCRRRDRGGGRVCKLASEPGSQLGYPGGGGAGEGGLSTRCSADRGTYQPPWQQVMGGVAGMETDGVRGRRTLRRRQSGQTGRRSAECSCLPPEVGRTQRADGSHERANAGAALDQTQCGESPHRLLHGDRTGPVLSCQRAIRGQLCTRRGAGDPSSKILHYPIAAILIHEGSE